MKYWIQCVLFVLLFFFFSLPAWANSQTEEYVGETLDEIGDTLEEAIPDEAEELLAALDLTDLNLQQILSLRPEQFFELLTEQFFIQWKEPVAVLGQILGVLLLTAMLGPLKESILKQNSAWLFSFVALICLCTVFSEPVVLCVEDTMESMERCSKFLLSLIPVLGAILTVGGQAATAGGYQLILFTVCQLVSQLAVSTALPLMSIYFALSMISGIFSDLGLQGLVGGIKNLVCWGLGIVTTLFVGVLSLQTFVSSNVDVVTLKASRFLMGSFIPVVGSILSEAFGAAQGCLSLIRSTVGTFGVIAALCILLPVLLRVSLWYFITWAALQLSALLQVKELDGLLKGANNTFAILLALLLCFFLLMVVATTVVIFIGTGG